MKTLTTTLAILLSVAAMAQTEDFKSKYERQTRNLGFSGVGVETIIDRWEEAEPDNPEVYNARFNFWLDKSASLQMVVKDSKKFLGAKPSLVLKDEAGKDVNYFEETVFVDSLFAESEKAIDKAISLAPTELRYRFNKITAMMNYEKESPDIAASELMELIDLDASGKMQWTLDSEAAANDVFLAAVSEYCYSFFKIGTPAGYEYFYSISSKMNKLYPKNATFISNMGAYWQVYKLNDKQAQKYYKKALKLEPDNYAAAKNMKIIEASKSKKGK